MHVSPLQIVMPQIQRWLERKQVDLLLLYKNSNSSCVLCTLQISEHVHLYCAFNPSRVFLYSHPSQ